MLRRSVWKSQPPKLRGKFFARKPNCKPAKRTRKWSESTEFGSQEEAENLSSGS